MAALTKDYLPKTDSALLAFATHAVAVLTAHPTDFGVTAAIATELTGRTSAFGSAVQDATNPDTRGKRTVFLKGQARDKLVAYLRSVMKQVTGTMTVTDAQRQQLGLPLPSGHRVPTPPPYVKPVLSVTGTDGRNVMLEIKQPTGRRGRPGGVANAMIFVASTEVGGKPPLIGDAAWQFAMTTTVMNVQIPCGDSDTGDTVHFTAFYCNAKAESGPTANAVSVALPAGGVVPALAVERMKLKAA